MASMASMLPQFNLARTRSYVFRLPLFTRLIITLIIGFWVVSIQSVWDVRAWGSLIPQETGIATLYRTNTFPLIHAGLFHAFLNTIALVPLLERFETEHGTLTSLLLFFGPLSTIPAIIYVVLERGVLRSNTAVLGASLWVFLLLGMEAIKTYRTNPHFKVGTVQVPTWTTPLVLAVFISVLVKHTSFLGHLCGLAVGYLFGLGYLKFLAPPEKILRWVEGKMNLLGRLPHYVSVDQKTYGRFGVLPVSTPDPESGIQMSYLGSTQRLGP
ncbi:hypothetical protein O988_01476 [Pseudogymnoascus sp. VKM F-3808]|nr:hypothetical protein O988_01476 [Pseudogymnoascus sp. VKM F-3808]